MTTADQQILKKLDEIKAAQGGGAAGVSDVTGSAPIASSGGTTPEISISPATTSDPGSMSAADKTKLDNAPADPQSEAQVAAAIAASGGKLLDTSGAPDNGDGANGDWSFDNATKTIYGPKAAGVWPAGVVLGGSESELVATVTGVDIEPTTPQDVYTVPVGKTFIFLRAVFSDATVPFGDGTTGALRVYESVTGTQLAFTSVSSTTQPTHYVLVQPVATSRLIAAGGKVQVRPDVTYGSPITCTVRVWGLLY